MNQNDDVTAIARRIEILTSTLQHLHHKRPSTSNKHEISSCLRHFTTLLTYGDEHGETEGKIAVTGTLSPQEHGLGFKVLVVTQNPNSSNDALDIKKVTIEPASFDDVVERYAQHLALTLMVNIFIQDKFKGPSGTHPESVHCTIHM